MHAGSEQANTSLLPKTLKPSAPLPKPALFSTGLLIAGLCIGALIRALGSPFLRECFQPVPLFSLNGLLSLIAGLLAAVVLHEAGHLWAAIMNDFEVSGVVVGPFRMVQLGKSWRFVLKKHRLSEASVSAFPRTMKNWRRRMITVVAAGPGATLVTGTAAILLLHFLGTGNNWFLWFLRAFVQVSFFIFLLGLVPNHKSLLSQNDAALLRSLWRRHSQSDELFLYHSVLQQGMRAGRPRNYSPDVIKRLTNFQGRPDFMAFFATTIASWAFDTGKNELAHAWDEQALSFCDRCASHNRTLILINSACFDVIYCGDLKAAQGKIDRLELSKIVSPYLQHRAAAVRYLASRRTTEALASITKSRAALPEHLQESGVEAGLLSCLHNTALAVQSAKLSPPVARWKHVALSAN